MRLQCSNENKRWLDLVHFGMADQMMKAYGKRVKTNPQAYYFPAGKGPTPASYTNIRLLFPTPASEVEFNSYF
ncbi:hypothetical protein [Pedobacter hartonius]|uniref:SusD family protein n=1 Tax=Pedobacter hartonius TaxID=425514 RepID=A0A1H4GBD3_9SPHI|nr:hypothetical protein [Pedobacter hartonius]SEB06591.1 hypothetical protein SAMN05443550_109172 [Pedobacter hartonius]